LHGSAIILLKIRPILSQYQHTGVEAPESANEFEGEFAGDVTVDLAMFAEAGVTHPETHQGVVRVELCLRPQYAL
jgi:hypothetical protein